MAAPVIPGGPKVGKGIQTDRDSRLDPLPLRFAPAGDDRKRIDDNPPLPC